MKPKKAAQLTSGLLASKGDAAPSSANRENLGPGNVDQALAFAAEAGSNGATAAKARRKGRVNLSLRLDADRHRRLKLATIHLGETAQTIMIRALDQYLDQVANDLLAISRGGPDGMVAAGAADFSTDEDE